MHNYSAEDKLRIVKLVLEAKHSIASISAIEGIHPTTLKEWIRNYQSIGSEAFYKKGWTKRTCAEKEAAVQEYLSGLGSLHDICKKHKISSTRTLRQWIALYNGRKKLKASGTGGSRLMTKGRKTTFEERVEIAAYSISHDHNYTETSEKFKVSYQQARNYTLKYETGGVIALQDKRGKRKPEDSLTEMEKLLAELKLEKAKRKHAEMELSFLKKLEEIERLTIKSQV